MQGGTLYILQSEQNGKFYIGSTIDLDRRLKDHKRGNTRTTRNNGPWVFVYSERFTTIRERKRERQLKRWKSHKRVYQLVTGHLVEQSRR